MINESFTDERKLTIFAGMLVNGEVCSRLSAFDYSQIHQLWNAKEAENLHKKIKKEFQATGDASGVNIIYSWLDQMAREGMSDDSLSSMDNLLKGAIRPERTGFTTATYLKFAKDLILEAKPECTNKEGRLDAWVTRQKEMLSLLGDGEKEEKEMDVLDLIAGEPVKLEFLPFLGKDGYIMKGQANMIAAYPKCGKTELVWEQCRIWVEMGCTILYITEETKWIWSVRASKKAPQSRGILLWSAMGKDKLEILMKIAKHSADIVIVDTPRNLGLLPAEETENGAIARAINEIIEACRPNKTLILLHHETKSGGEHGRGIAGGHALAGCLDSILEISRVSGNCQENRRLIKHLGRIESAKDLIYEMKEDGEIVAVGHATAYSEWENKVKNVLTNTPKNVTSICKELDTQNRSSIQRTLESLAKKGEALRDPPWGEEIAGRTAKWSGAVL